MEISKLMQKMIAFTAKDSDRVNHDINHFMKVWGFAKTIGELEKLDAETQYILEAAAIMHDIACPCCRRKFGSASGADQEKESPAILEPFLADTDFTAAEKERILFLISHHHTYTGVDGKDYQILLEADFLVNAEESNYPADRITTVRNHVFKTAAGTALLNEIYLN